MNICESYIINLKKDYGRLICSREIINIFDATVFEGNDCNDLDDNGYLLNIKTNVEYTQSAKLTKKLLLEHFLKTSNKKYIMVFEDDVYLHADLFDDKKRKQLFKNINEFLQKNKPQLLYLGISRHFISSETSTDNLSFISFKENFGEKIDLCSGAYGFILSRDMISIVLMRIANETLKDFAFDLFCLSYIGKTYPTECFVINPHIVVPDIEHSNIRDGNSQSIIWRQLGANLTNYQITTMGYAYVKTDVNADTKYFDKMMMSLTPLIKIIYYSKKKIINRTNAHFIIDTTLDKKIKYTSAQQIIDTIITNLNKCNQLTISNSLNVVIFTVTYFNNLTEKINILIDI